MPTLRWPEYAGYAATPVGSAVAGICRLRRGRFMPVGDMDSLLKHPSVQDCKTSFVLQRWKGTTAVPL